MLKREKELKSQVAAELLELKQQMHDLDINRFVTFSLTPPPSPPLHHRSRFAINICVNMIKRERQRAADMRHAFRAAEERLRSSIKHRDVELQHRFGKLKTGSTGGVLENLARVWKADLLAAPQPLKIRIDTLRVAGERCESLPSRIVNM